MNTPCRNCAARVVGCHAECEKYLDFRKKMDEMSKKRMAKILVSDYMSDRYMSLLRYRHIRKG